MIKKTSLLLMMLGAGSIAASEMSLPIERDKKTENPFVAKSEILKRNFQPLLALDDSDKDWCIEKCSFETLPTSDFGFEFWNCVNRCMGIGICL